VKGRRGDVVAAAFEALFSDPVGQGDPAGAENVVEVTLGNVMRGGDLGRAEMRVVQMCAGVLQDPQRRVAFSASLPSSAASRWVVMTARMSSMLGALNASAPETVNRSGREASRRK
jgi:hypothetical protein